MLFYKKLKEVPISELMLPRDKSLESYWGKAKQQQWGQLTGFAIERASEKFKNGDFDSITDAFNYLAKFRTLIGALLNHDKDVGVLRDRGEGAFTPITEHEESPYKEMYAEFHSMFENAKSNQCDVEGEAVTFYGEDLSKAKFKRSTIESIDHGYKIYHPIDSRHSMTLANGFYQNLKSNNTLNIQEKQYNIEAILFHVCDCMPCIRGSSAVAIMLFYALEDAYTSNIRCINQLKSKYGNIQGVTPDIAAMLCLTLSDFQDYLKTCNYDSEVKVIKSKTGNLLNISPQETLDLLRGLCDSLYTLDSKFRQFCGLGLYQFGYFDWEKIFTFLLKMAEDSKDDSIVLSQLKNIKTSLVQEISQRYPYMYLLLYKNLRININKNEWPIPTECTPPTEEYKTKLNDNLSVLNRIIRSFIDSVMSLPFSEEFDFCIALPRRYQDDEEYFLSCALLDNAVKKSPSVTKELDYFIGIVVEMDALKGKSISQDEIVNQLFKKFYEHFYARAKEKKQEDCFEEYVKDSTPRVINQLKLFLNEMHEQLDKVKNGLNGLNAFQEILKLDQENLDVLVSSKIELKKRLK